MTVTTTSNQAKAANGFSMICCRNKATSNPYSTSQSVNCENGSAIPIKVNNAYILFIIISIYQLILVFKTRKRAGTNIKRYKSL